MRPFALAAFLFVSAGCLTASNPIDEGLIDEAQASALRFLPEIKVGVGGDAETSLHVSPDGQTILGCSHGGFTRPSPLWFSTDAGATFERFVPTAHPVSGDCDVAIGPEGNWYMLYDTIASASVARSSDFGESWQIVYTAAVPMGGVDRPWIQAAGRNVVYMTYANVMVAQPAIDMFAKSTDGGATWTEQRLMSRVESPTYPNTVTGRMVLADNNQTIRVPLARFNGYTGGNSVFDVATSRDGGMTWSNSRAHGPIAAPLQLPPMSRDGDGRLYFGITAGAVDNATVSLVLSEDDGATWSDPWVIATEQSFPGLSGVWIDGRPGTGVTMAWMHTVDVEGQEAWTVSVARVDPVAKTVVLVDLFEPLVGSQPVYEFLMVKHDAEGRAYVFYPLAREGCKDSPPTAVAQNRNNQCVWLSIEDVPSPPSTVS